MTSRTQTRSVAHNKWGTILTHFDFTKQQLSGAHQKCPMCGGKDRWRYSNHDGNGSYFCSGCGPGSGFDLLMGVFGWDFKTAAQKVDALVGAGEISGKEETFQPERNPEKRRRDLNNLWTQGVKITPESVAGGNAEQYLMERGLLKLFQLRPALFADCRYNGSMYHKDTNLKVPGLMWLIRTPAGQPISIHRTFLNPRDKKIMPPTHPLLGSGVWLGRPNDGRLVIGEGIETTLSGCEKFNCAGMSVISAGMMEGAVIPSGLTEVIILADNDRSFTGQKAAFTLARKLDNRKDLNRVAVVMPKKKGDDFNDIASDSNGVFTYSVWSNE